MDELENQTVAVIIPVYGGQAYLAEAIESVLRQTRPATEILIIDDGSPDGSLRIAQAYAESHSTVRVVSQVNAGVSASRNRGAALTTATWLAFLDQDDLWEAAKLQQQLETLLLTPGADLCVTEQRYLQPRGDGTFSTTGVIGLPPAREIGRRLYGSLRFVPSAVMVRRDRFLAAGGFDSSAQPCEDWDLWLRLEQAGATFVVCHEPLLLYRYHATNGSLNGQKMYLGELRTYERRIAPSIHPMLRPLHRQRARSGFLAGRALVDREQNRPHLRSMLASIFGFPLGNWQRYKMLLSMLLKRAHSTG